MPSVFDRLGWVDIDDVGRLSSGWYPVLECCDPQEGFFPGALFYDGTSWRDKTMPVAFVWPLCFPRKTMRKTGHTPETLRHNKMTKPRPA
ncbi:MAG: hypothetical protein EBT13_15935 [Rhodobacteraceae bacterium]|nr:hypothetical protein [Paracoccaceae bacterium]